MNRLDRPERTKLTIWVSQNEQLLKDNCDTDCAKQAAKDLGFTVTTCNIRDERKIQYPNLTREKGAHPGSPLIPMVRLVERKVDALAERLTKLEQSLGIVS